MQLLDVLRTQHREVADLLERIRTEDDRKARKALVAEVAEKLAAHMAAEEKAVYPLAARTLDDEELVVEAAEAHALARQALASLRATPAGDRRLAARAKVLSDLLGLHIEEEENHLVPELESHLDEESVAEATQRFEKRFAQALEGKSPRERMPPQRAARSPRAGTGGRRGSTRKGAGAKATAPRRGAPRGG